jgi:putative aminopeptidase FrvX
MLNHDSIAFLKQLLDAPGPSGFEARPARIWRERAKTFAEVRGDVVGNSIATVNPKGAPTVMLAGHVDEIGVIVTYIDDDGYLYISHIGGWDAQVLVGQRILFLGRAGDVIGVIGRKPVHLIKVEDRERATKFTEMWVDIGASSRAEAEARVAVGDAGVIDARAVDFPNGRIVSRSIDNRIGAFVVLEALRRYAESPGAARVVAIATTQEEIAYRGGGALVGAVGVSPQAAIVVDVTFATDHPGVEKKEHGDHKLGSGPVLTRGSIISPVLFSLLRETAEKEKISYSVQAAGRDTSTDADAIHLAREGVATALIGVPNRYMHSPNETVSLEDLDRTAELIAAACRAITPATDFAAR